jgi:tetratricopeptide (TPR) repeat protein
MKYSILAVLLLFCASPSYAQHHSPHSGEMRPVTLMTGLGNGHHPVSTSNAEAQRFFDQGLALLYAFNHAESIRSFKRAAELDPNLAMAHWGIALALGPNINQDVDPASEKAAYDAVQKALSMKAPLTERAYIEALAKRYSTDPKADLKQLAVDYKDAMGRLMKNYPDDLDAATLYAESVMDLRPWKLWSLDGKPAEGTLEIIAVLESVLRRDPEHIGANHYYIHVVEASPHPEWALPSAERLGRTVKTAGHLVHMPSHVYMRAGDYASASASNKEAAAVDRAYIESNEIKGMYAAGYYSHNLHFLAIAASMQGRFAESLAASEQLSQNVKPYLTDVPSLEGFLPTSTIVLVRFRKWDEMLNSPQPEQQLPLTNAMWHWGRAMAYGGKGQVQQAVAEQKLFIEWQKKVPEGALWGLNGAGSILKIAGHILNGKLALAQKNPELGIKELQAAVAAEDVLAYDEPPAWFLPARESLGGALMASARYTEAERIFRDDLERNRRNGRSLFGLKESLKAQGRTDASRMVELEFQAAWKDADSELSLDAL